MAESVKSRSKSSTPSRTSPFKMEHLLMFGLEITKTGADSRVHGHKPSVVRAVLCLFCMHLGRDAVELDDGSKRQRTQNTHYFTAAFRKENFTLLVKLQHPAYFESTRRRVWRKKKLSSMSKNTYAGIDSSVLKRSADGAEHTSV